MDTNHLFWPKVPLTLTLTKLEAIKTISPTWLPLSSLQSEYKSSFKELYRKYIGYKKVKSDGNCYYRSVISTFLLKLFHFNQPTSTIQYYRDVINSLRTTEIPDFQREIKFVKQFINGLYTKRYQYTDYQSKVSLFTELLQKLQDESFDLYLIKFARSITCAALNSRICSELVEPLLYDGREAVERSILTMGKEAEGVELLLLPLGLNIRVHQKSFLNNSMISTTFPTETDDGYKRLKVEIICKQRGQYSALYSIQDLEDEDYNMRLGTYMINSS